SEPEFKELSNLDADTNIPQELPVDSSWDEVYDSIQTYSAGHSDSDSDDFIFQRAPAQSLQDYLHWQMELTPFSEQDYAIATAIIDAVDDDGYLTVSVDDIHQGLATQINGLEVEEVTAVLHRVQNFDPPGVAAPDLATCLAIQLNQLPDDTPWKKEALTLVTRHLELLAKKDLARIRQTMDLSEEDLNRVVTLIRTL